jgi:hypothetical protein
MNKIVLALVLLLPIVAYAEPCKTEQDCMVAVLAEKLVAAELHAAALEAKLRAVPPPPPAAPAPPQ